MSETKPGGLPKAFVSLSEKNRGKYAIDKDGFITGGFDCIGFPFPGLTKDDKDFVTKLMWNCNYRYMGDNFNGPDVIYSKRKGEKTTWTSKRNIFVDFINRLYDAPKPFYKTPIGLQNAALAQYLAPADVKDLMVVSHRFLDPRTPDNSFMYIPSLRRVLRGEAGQRSTPIQGGTQAMDDLFGGWDGKTYEFTYKFIREQKVLAPTEANIAASRTGGSLMELGKKLYAQSGEAPFPSEDWSLRDVYVIEVKAKDPRYPQGKKIIYIDKESLWCLFATAYDRAAKLWKTFQASGRRCSLPDGDTALYIAGSVNLDVQFGLCSTAWLDFIKITGNDVRYSDMMPSALISRAR